MFHSRNIDTVLFNIVAAVKQSDSWEKCLFIFCLEYVQLIE